MATVALASDLMGLGMAPAVARLIGVQIPAPLAGVGTAQSGAALLVPGAINQVTTSAGQTAFLLPGTQDIGTSLTV